MLKMIVTKHVQLVLSIVNHAQLANTECVIEDRSIATRNVVEYIKHKGIEARTEPVQYTTP